MGKAQDAHAAAADEAMEVAEQAQVDKIVEPKPPKRGVGTVACEAIRAGKTNEEALAAVKAEFPEASTSMASINWYRNNMRTNGEDIPTARDLKAGEREKVKAEKAAAKATEKAAKAEQRAREKAAKKKTTTDSAAAIADAEAGEAEGESGFLS